ncbi:hypothetical protein L9F63_018302, partial [Diploptera punctata]
MKSCSVPSEKYYQYLFRACPLLETVLLESDMSINGKCLYGLKNTRLKCLVLSRCNNLCLKKLMNVLCKLEHLEHLSLRDATFTDQDISTLVQTVPRLQSLSMVDRFPFLNWDSLKAIGNLKDLIQLNLQNNYSVNDEIMKIIAQNCKKLQEVNIT